MGQYITTVTELGARLSRIPIRHACGHFEMRLTRWNEWNPNTTQDPPHPDGFLRAGSECSSCSPQGREIKPHFDTLAEAKASANV